MLLFICLKKKLHIYYIYTLFEIIDDLLNVFYMAQCNGQILFFTYDTFLKRIPKQLISLLRVLTPPFKKGVVNKLNLVNPLFFTSFNKTILLLKLYFKVSVITGYKDLFDIIMKEGAHKFHQF